MSNVNRRENLVQAAKAKAIVMSFLRGRESPVGPREIIPRLADVMPEGKVLALLDRMARNGQIYKTPLTDGRYKVGYFLPSRATMTATPQLAPVQVNINTEQVAKKLREGIEPTPPDMDIVLGRDGRSVVLSLGGRRVRITMEG